MLLRVYTQNIDTLERQTGMSGDKVIECHGSYATNTCLTCGQKYSQKWFKDKIFNLDSKNNKPMKKWVLLTKTKGSKYY